MFPKTMASTSATVFPIHDLFPRHEEVHRPRLRVQTLTNASAFEEPHRHSFTQILLIKRGAGTHYTDFTAREIREDELYVLAPGQVHSWRAGPGLECTAVLFAEDILNSLGALPEKLRELLLVGAAPVSPEEAALARIARITDALEEAPTEESSRHLLAALLYEVLGAQEIEATQVMASHTTLTQSFMRHVVKVADARLTVAQSAAFLGVTAGHLTEQVVLETGVTPGRILRSAILTEAKRLLVGSELSAAQISTQLGFNEPSYFSRFFRREAGCTPSAFREGGELIVSASPNRKKQHVR